MLYELNISTPQSSPRVRLKNAGQLKVTEKHIEDFLAGHLDEIIPEDQLMLIGQERKRQEEADLFALDKNGVLYIFELKRWEGKQENLLQVMRYGQIFGRFDYQRLEDLARRHNRLEGELSTAHQTYFELDTPLDADAFNHDQVFVVVTSGLDKETLDVISYWRKKGLKVHSITFKLYEIEGKPHIYFEVYNPEQEVIIESDPGIYIVNTNATFMPDAWQDMLRAPKAAAYFDRKLAVANIPRGSTVYLYHTKVGIIAKGRTTGEAVPANVGTDVDAEYHVPLQLDWALRNKAEWHQAITASEINATMNSGHRFRHTALTISTEMAATIDRLREARVAALVN
jgi:hypothetical protein